MNRSKKLVVLAGLLALAIAAYFLVDLLAPRDGEPAPGPEAATLLTLAPDTVTRLSITRQGGQPTVLARQGDRWAWEGDAAFPLDQTKVEAMLTQLEKVAASQTITEAHTAADYGLDAPVLTVSAQAGEAAHTFAFGAAGAFTDGGYYAYVDEDTSRVHVLSAKLFGAFDYDLLDLPVMDTIPFVSDGQTLTIESSDGIFSIDHVADGSTVSYTTRYNWFLGPEAGRLPLSTAKVNAYFSVLSGLTWDACVAYSAGQADLSAYGLDSASATRLRVDFGEGRSFGLDLGRYEGSQCYARPVGSDMVYLIDAQRADQLAMVDYEALRPDDVFPIDWDLVTAFEATWDGQTRRVTFEIETVTAADGTTATQKVYKSDGQTLERDKVGKVLSQLAGLPYNDIAENATGRGEILKLTCFLNLPDYPSVTLTLYQYNNANALSELEGERRLLVSTDSVNSVLANLGEIFQ